MEAKEFAGLSSLTCGSKPTSQLAKKAIHQQDMQPNKQLYRLTQSQAFKPTNLHTFEKTDTEGQVSAIDIIHQLEHLPGIKLDGNHTISIRGLQSNSSGGHSSSPLVTIDIMLMDTASAFMPESEDTPGFTLFTVSVASAIALFVNQRKLESESIYDED